MLTDLEFYELRYSGRAATWVRGFRAVYLGVVFNLVIMASVNLAAAKIANVLLGWSIGQTLLVCGVINVAFAATSGLWGVLVTDMLQFGIAMGGSFAAAWYALAHPAVGGLDGLFAKIDPYLRRDRQLDTKDVLQLLFISLRPHLRTGRGINELDSDSDSISSVSNAAFHYGPNV